MKIVAVPLMREPDAVLQMVLFAAWTLQCLSHINAFTLLGSTVMREAAHYSRGQQNRVEAPGGLDTA